MSEFRSYFEEGREHILDYMEGYDHILFVVALCALYVFRDWKHILILVTAFTIGHSVTLALTTLNIINVDVEMVEFFISLSIFIVAFSNLFRNEESIGDRKVNINYIYALVFGLIHGMGFASRMKAILGRDRTIWKQLLAFNLGLEFGQIIIVVIFMTICFLLVDLFGVSRRDWKMVISSMVAGMAILLMKERMFWID
jgi:hypothetical protein